MAYYQDRIYTGRFRQPVVMTGSSNRKFNLSQSATRIKQNALICKPIIAGYDRKLLMYGYDKSISNNKGRAVDIIHTVSGTDLKN